jgi:hypothetical protein
MREKGEADSRSKVQSFSVPIRLEVGIKKKRTYYLNLNGYR